MSRVAIVGSGPAGFYAALRLLEKTSRTKVDLFERLPFPYGLVRYGVAPDHPEVKNCEERFKEVAASRRFRFFGNVSIGQDVSVRDLSARYNAVLFAYGAQSDRELGVPGESSPAVVPARKFVGWYNGHPDLQNMEFPLSEVEVVATIGNGNVALDLSRILLGGVDRLRHTDITDAALETLSRSRVKTVNIVGRRALWHASFTNKELREMLNLDDCWFQYEGAAEQIREAERRRLNLPRLRHRTVQLLLKHMKEKKGEQCQWSLDFLHSPAKFIPRSEHSRLLDKIVWDTMAANEDGSVVIRTGHQTKTKADLALTSIGLRSEPLPGFDDLNLEFDTSRHILANQKGKASGSKNIFVGGWLHSGPNGVIASTMMDAFAVADEILSFVDENEARPGVGLNALPRVITWDDWLKLDQEELARGKQRRKTRVKFTTLEEALSFLDR